MDKLAAETFKTTGLSVVGGVASKAAYLIQENVYNRPNDLQPVSEFFGNPDYFTAFTYPLTLMYAMKTFFGLASLMNKEMGNRFEAKVIDVVSKWTPVVVMSLTLWHELATKPTYVDHPALDLLAGATAGLVYIMTTETRDDIKLGLNKIGNIINREVKTNIQAVDN